MNFSCPDISDLHYCHALIDLQITLYFGHKIVLRSVRCLLCRLLGLSPGKGEISPEKGSFPRCPWPAGCSSVYHHTRKYVFVTPLNALLKHNHQSVYLQWVVLSSS